MLLSVRMLCRRSASLMKMTRRSSDMANMSYGEAAHFSSFGYLAATVSEQDADIAVETVAGVTSFNASAARLGMPLADLDDRIAVLPAGYGVETIDHLLDEHDTLVLLKVKPLLDDIIDLLDHPEACRAIQQLARLSATE